MVSKGIVWNEVISVIWLCCVLAARAAKSVFGLKSVLCLDSGG